MNDPDKSDGPHGAVVAGRARPRGARRILGIVVGWLLVVIGIAALVLPGPGLLALVGGLALLSQQYEWARRWLQPVKKRAFAAAEQGVRTKRSITASFTGAALLIALGVFWGLQPPMPGWWPFAERWWLPGGWSVGSGLIVSGLFAAVFIIYSIRRFRPDPAPSARPAA